MGAFAKAARRRMRNMRKIVVGDEVWYWCVGWCDEIFLRGPNGKLQRVERNWRAVREEHAVTPGIIARMIERVQAGQKPSTGRYPHLDPTPGQ